MACCLFVTKASGSVILSCCRWHRCFSAQGFPVPSAGLAPSSGELQSRELAGASPGQHHRRGGNLLTFHSARPSHSAILWPLYKVIRTFLLSRAVVPAKISAMCVTWAPRNDDNVLVQYPGFPVNRANLSSPEHWSYEINLIWLINLQIFAPETPMKWSEQKL